MDSFQVDIYKINHLSLNQKQSQFCMCTNQGIKTYTTDTFDLLEDSNTESIIIGDIETATLLHELNIAVFAGSSKNQLYQNTQLVFYDLSKHNTKYFTILLSPIVNIKSITKYVFVSTKEYIDVYPCVDFNSITLMRRINLINKERPYFDIFLQNIDNINSIGMILFNSEPSQINLFYFYENQLEEGNKFIINSYKDIQSFFYVDTFKQIFIVERQGSYISSFDSRNKSKEKIYEFYRGKNEGIITSIIGLNEDCVAMSNLNKTIHVFFISNPTGQNLATKIFSAFSFFTPDLIYSSIQIPLSEINEDSNTDSEFYQTYFNKKGVLLSYFKENKELRVIGYNGMGYIIKIDFTKINYEVKLKKKFVDQNFMDLGVSVNMAESQMTLPTYSEEKGLQYSQPAQEDKWKVI